MSKTLREYVIESINKEVEYHTKQAKSYRAYLKDKRTLMLANKLESIFMVAQGIKEVNAFYSGGMVIKFDDYDNAREFVSHVIDKLKLEKVERQMEQYSTKPTWYYSVYAEIEGHSFSMLVYPAQPVEGCDPEIENEYREPRRRWVCKKRSNSNGH